MQGSLLAHFTPPIFLRSVVVGRRFSKPHLERALCCRVQDFEPHNKGLATLPTQYRVHHPSMLCTAVKLDDSLIPTDGEPGHHADFGEARCMCWAAGDACAELIDGNSGALEPSGLSSRVSPSSKLQGFLALWQEAYLIGYTPSTLASGPPPSIETLLHGLAASPSATRHLKLSLCDPDYEVARELLLARPEFAAWRLAKLNARIGGVLPSPAKPRPSASSPTRRSPSAARGGAPPLPAAAPSASSAGSSRSLGSSSLASALETREGGRGGIGRPGVNRRLAM